MCDIKPLYVWHHMNSMWHHNLSLWHNKTVFITPRLPYSWHQTHCIPHDIHSTCDITATVTMTRPTMFLTLYTGYMISYMVNEWQQNDCIWHDTQCICVIKPTWVMTSHTMYVWNHTHCTYDTIGTLYDITSTLADNTPLFICHGTHSLYDIICMFICHVTHPVCMTT